MKYLRKFDTDAEKLNWQMGDEYVAPNVVLVGENDILYNIPKLGRALIQHINGNLYSTEQWVTNGFAPDEANGVAVYGDNARFVIAKTNISNSLEWSSQTDKLVDGITTSTSYADVAKDYAGVSNTENMLLTDKSKAGYSCANFVFPNGQTGYLPSMGEWVEAYRYKENINAAMSLISGNALGDNYYWSSSQGSASTAWVINWGNSEKRTNSKSATRCVRAFLSF